jgi:hypothetical protein
MEVTCPLCRAKIATADINVSTDVALCRACGNTFRLSEVVGGSGMVSSLISAIGSTIGAPSGPVDLNSPPEGAWYEPTADGFTAGATTRSWMALFIVPFTCVWAGGSMFGIYGTQFIKGHFSLGPSLFGIPFVIGSVLLVSWCAMSVAGKVTVSVQGDRLAIFTGVGPFGLTRISSLSDFKTAREDFGYGSMNTNRQSRVIRLEGARAMAFGSMLTVERRYFLLSALQSALHGSNRSPIFVSR